MIAAIAVSLLALIAFVLSLWLTRVVTAARKSVGAAMVGLGAMLDPDLDDDAKEKALRRSGLALMLSALNIAWRFAAALAAAAAPIALADVLGLVASHTVLALMLRVDYIVIVSVIAIAIGELVRRRMPARAPAPPTGHSHYSEADRVFHMVAFASPAVLRAASWCEDRLGARAQSDPEQPPIFVTSLARAGTTALLNALHDVPGIATHIYRDMPFVTAPVLWDRMAGGAKRKVSRRPRVHGDGLEIDLDSPEAFEEVLWRMYWPSKYAGRRIALWGSEDADGEAERFFRLHMSKIIRARSGQAPVADGPMRYCSKNNANIARLAYLPQAFPGCRIVVQVRRPESHAASLFRQHRNFSQIQAEDDFVKRYMRDIGHFEFGLIHKPIAFAGFEQDRYTPDSPDYWLYYWIHAFREVLSHPGEHIIVAQADLREHPQEMMQALCGRLGLETGGRDFAPYFRSMPNPTARQLFSPRLYDEAAAVYAGLSARALVPDVGIPPYEGRQAAFSGEPLMRASWRL